MQTRLGLHCARAEPRSWDTQANIFFNTLILYVLVIWGAAQFQGMGTGAPFVQAKSNTDLTLYFRIGFCRIRWMSCFRAVN